MNSTNSPQAQNFQYKIGFSLKEFNQIGDKKFEEIEVEKILSDKGLEYKKVIVKDALTATLPECLKAIYKNPSSMRLDAPHFFSCSSLISYLYTQAGVWMPSLSIDKYVFGTPISKEDLTFGDLIFANSGIGMIRTETVEYNPGTQVPEGVDHVGMYLGENKVLHATKKFGGVIIETLQEFESTSKIVGYRRVADVEEERYVVLVPNNISDLVKKSGDLIKNLLYLGSKN